MFAAASNPKGQNPVSTKKTKPEKTEELAFPPKPAAKAHRILLVDDDKFLLEFFGRILSAQGFVAVMASNGSEAQDVLKNEEAGFDLVVVDLLMPVQSGWNFIEFLKNDPRFKDLPIIALTGLSLSYEEFERIRQQTSAVLLKGDFEIARFTETINQLLRDADKAKALKD